MAKGSHGNSKQEISQETSAESQEIVNGVESIIRNKLVVNFNDTQKAVSFTREEFGEELSEKFDFTNEDILQELRNRFPGWKITPFNGPGTDDILQFS